MNFIKSKIHKHNGLRFFRINNFYYVLNLFLSILLLKKQNIMETKIKELRARNNFTQEQLADLV
jgi:hypothetical protein